jgi:FMN reductase
MSSDLAGSESADRKQVTIVAIGGSTRPGSSSEMAVRVAGRAAEVAGARVIYITGRDLMLPIYDTESDDRTDQATALVEAIRGAHGLLIASPGYHGGISGMIKNALDYIEDLREDDQPYLHGRAVGCIAVAYGWQATVSTLQQIRQVTHALRGWPTPLGATINAQTTRFSADATTDDESAAQQLQKIGEQVVEFAQMRGRSLPE